MPGRPRKYPKELGKVISKTFSVPEGAVTYLEGLSVKMGRPMTELLGYAIIGIEAEKAEEFFSVMKETQTLLREQMNTIKTNNELLKGLEQRHDSVYSVLKDVGTLPESIELALSEKITRMESQNTTRQQALMRVEGILDELGSIALGEGKVFRSRPLLKNIVTSRIVKRIKK